MSTVAVDCPELFAHQQPRQHQHQQHLPTDQIVRMPAADDDDIFDSGMHNNKHEKFSASIT